MSSYVLLTPAKACRPGSRGCVPSSNKASSAWQSTIERTESHLYHRDSPDSAVSVLRVRSMRAPQRLACALVRTRLLTRCATLLRDWKNVRLQPRGSSSISSANAHHAKSCQGATSALKEET